jgi:hypothetical protein
VGPSSQKFDAMESTSGFAAKNGAAEAELFVNKNPRTLDTLILRTEEKT